MLANLNHLGIVELHYRIQAVVRDRTRRAWNLLWYTWSRKRRLHVPAQPSAYKCVAIDEMVLCPRYGGVQEAAAHPLLR